MAYETGTTLRAELERHARESNLPIVLAWDDGVEVPRRLEGLAQSVLGEALRNVKKHADPSRVSVAVQRDEDTFTLEVRNDGITGGVAAGLGHSGGMGLRLAAFEALQHNGFVEFGPEKSAQPPGWRVRLVLPVKEDTGER